MRKAFGKSAGSRAPARRRALGGRPARLRARLRRTPLPLALLLAAAAVLSLAWDLSLPAFQGPDEDAHFAYVQHLAETGELPSPVSGGTPLSSEQQEAMDTLNLVALRGVPLAAPAWTSSDLKLWDRVQRSLPPGSRANGDGPNPQARNPPFYYAVMAVPYRVFLWLGLLKRIFLMRLVGTLLYLATIAMTWLLAAELFVGSRLKPLLAASTVMLEPQLTFMSVVINADIMVIALTTAVLLASVRLVKYGPSMTRVLTSSLLTVAAVLTHGRGLVNLPVLATALAVSFAVHRPALRHGLRRGAAAIGTVLAGFVAYLLIERANGVGSLYGGNVSSLGSGGSARGFNLKQFLSYLYQFYLPRLPSMGPRLGPEFGYRQMFIETFYGKFGWLEVTLPQGVYEALQLASGAGLVGFYTMVAARWRTLARRWPVVITLLALAATQVLFLHYVSYRSLLNSGGEVLIVGRYLLPMISLFGLAIAFTVGSLPRRASVLAAAVVIACGLLLSLLSLGITAARFYA